MASKTKRKKKDRKWMQKAVKRPGALTRKAKRYGMTPLQFARYVKAHPEKFDTLTKQQANFALTAAKISKRRRKKRRRK